MRERRSADCGAIRRFMAPATRARRVAGAIAPAGVAATILRVTGQRLWHPGAAPSKSSLAMRQYLCGRRPPPIRGARLTPTAVEVLMSAASGLLDTSAILYPVAVQVDGARSRDPAVTFTLGSVARCPAPERRTSNRREMRARRRGHNAISKSWAYRSRGSDALLAEPGSVAAAGAAAAYQAGAEARAGEQCIGRH